MDIAHGELVEKELDAMIERRSRKKDPDEESDLWRESIERYNARRQEEMRAAWCDHQDQAARHRAVLEALITRHEEQAAKLMDVQSEGDAA